MLKSEKHPYQLSQVNAQSDDEGGLNLGQVGATLRRRALLIAGVTGVIATAAVLKAETDPPVYQGEFQILTKPVTGENIAVANVPQTLSYQKGIAPPETVQPVTTTIQVLTSPGVLAPIIDKLQSKYPELTYKSLTDSLSITSKEDNILKIEYVDSDDKLVKDVLQSISDAYLNYSLAERQADINQAMKFVEQRINNGGLRKRVEDWQDKLLSLRRTNDLMEPSQKSEQVSTEIATLTQQRLDNQVQLQQMQAQYQQLQTELRFSPGERAGNSVLTENVRYQKILDQIQQLDIEIKKQSTLFTEQNPAFQDLQDKKAQLLPLLSIEEQRVQKDFQSRIRSLQARDVSLAKKIIYFNNYLKTLATVTRDYDNIQRELKIASETLNQFLAKQQALEIEKAEKHQPWELLDPKLTTVNKPEAVSKGLKQNLALGGMLGLVLGIGAALVVDKLSNVFYTSRDLKEATGLPLLGVIPLRKEIGFVMTENVETSVQQADRTSFFEVFRSLYINILLLGSDTPIRSVVISSAAEGDGKTSVAIHLALAAAAMGQRVLLVDANLRSPILHKQVGLMNIQGLTDIISSDSDWSNIIERSPLEDNLYVLSAGPVPPDSIRLLASQKMQDLMSDLHASFDLVIYDTPPLVGFADANLLAANTDGVIMVAGLGKLKRTVFQQALADIQVAGTSILGLIANKSKDSAPATYNYYQQYYKHKSAQQGSRNQETNSVTRK